MIRRIGSTAFSLLLIPVLQACVSWHCKKGTGPVTQRTLQVAPFKGIAAQGSLEVRLKQGSAQKVEVEGQSNLIDLIGLDVKGGVWQIGTKQCYNTDQPFIVHVTVPTIDHISVQGSGDVKGLGSFVMAELTVEVQGSGGVELSVDARHIHATVQGSGDIDLDGTCGDLSAMVQGSGGVDADGMVSAKVEASVQGSGDISVHATEQLTANIAGSGDIHYKGSPARLDKRVAGSGEVDRLP